MYFEIGVDCCYGVQNFIIAISIQSLFSNILQILPRIYGHLLDMEFFFPIWRKIKITKFGMSNISMFPTCDSFV